jgi:hypothetical protein
MLNYYQTQISRSRPRLVVLVFPGSLKSAQLPHQVFGALQGPAASSQKYISSLAQVGAAGTGTPGLYYFALALDRNLSYQLVSTGPFNSGFGSYGKAPGTFMIWRLRGSAV